MEEMAAVGGGGEVEAAYTKDGSVDLKGRPVLISKTGGWKAASFIVVYEMVERLAFYGIATNLIVYLTTQLHQGTVAAANNVTNWVGTVWMTPILGAYIADAHLGRFWTFVIASIIYLSVTLFHHFFISNNSHTVNKITIWINCIVQMKVSVAPNYSSMKTETEITAKQGMVLVTLSVSIPSLKPPSCQNQDSGCRAGSLQVAVFMVGLYIVAVGTGGTKPNISTMGADQFDDFEPKERKQKLSFFNWWMFSIFFSTIFANSFLVYIQDNVGWALGYGIPTIGLILAILVFFVGSPFYRHQRTSDSPFAKMAKVIVAAIRKRMVPLPTDPRDLHELQEEEYAKSGQFQVKSTSSLQFLDKAAVRVGPSTAWTLCTVTQVEETKQMITHHRFLDKAAVRVGPSTPWTLCTVTQVEETKQMIKMFTIFLACFIPNTITAQGHTLFIKQGTTLDRSLGPHFKIPAASLTSFVNISMLISLAIYDKWFVPLARKYTNNPRGITMLQRLGAGLILHIIIMVISALVEKERLSFVRHHGLEHSKDAIPLTIFILLPQFVLVGVADALVEVAKLEFFYDQAPATMKSLGTSYFTSCVGLGNFLSSFILKTVAKVTSHGGREGWITNNANMSRLDYYYGLLAAISAVNFIYFLFASRLYKYRAEPCELDVELQKPCEPSTNKT
ncbi:NRT1-PTR FAMILY 1-3 protein [Nymphaea thermarum]|nr:NRT1-PTR FAMILY 1-3 protein [Nymphaea thermarum]